MTLWSYNSCKTFVASLTIKNPVAFLFYVFLRQKLWKSSHKNALSSRKRQKSYENYWLSKWYIQDGKKTLEIFMDFHRVRKNPQKVSFELSHQKYWSFSLFSISKIWICTLTPNHQNYPFESKRLMCFFLKGSSTTFRFSVFCRPVKISFSALIDEGAVAMATVVVVVLKANMGLMRWESLYAFMPTVLAYNVIKRLATTLAMPPLIPSPRRKLLWVLVTFLLKINLEKTETCLWPRVLLQESPSFLFIKSWDSEVAFFLKNRLLSRFLFALFATLLSFFWFFEVHLFVLLLAFESLYSLLSS